MQSLTLLTKSSLILGPLVSPAKTTLFVVVKVSHATLETGSLQDKNQQPCLKFYHTLCLDVLQKLTTSKKIIIIFHYSLCNN